MACRPWHPVPARAAEAFGRTGHSSGPLVLLPRGLSPARAGGAPPRRRRREARLITTGRAAAASCLGLQRPTPFDSSSPPEKWSTSASVASATSRRLGSRVRIGAAHGRAPAPVQSELAKGRAVGVGDAPAAQATSASVGKPCRWCRNTRDDDGPPAGRRRARRARAAAAGEAGRRRPLVRPQPSPKSPPSPCPWLSSMPSKPSTFTFRSSPEATGRTPL